MLKPKENSLFAILLRSPWWASLLIAVALYFASRLFLPPVAAAASTFPWVGLSLYALWRQSRVPSASRVEATLAQLREMDWEQFAPLMAAAFRREGYEVSVPAGKSSAIDLELRRQGYLTVASCRRWKVAQPGIAPMEELARAIEAADSRGAVFVTAGEPSPKAAAFAAQKGIRILGGADLVKLVGRLPAKPAPK